MKILNSLLLTSLLSILSITQTQPVLAKPTEPPSVTKKTGFVNVMDWKMSQNTNSESPRYATVPADFPLITVTVPASNTAEGNIFLATFAGAKSPYLLILDPTGEPVFYQKESFGKYLTDFKKQPNGNLTFYLGIGFPDSAGEYYEINDKYQLTKTWQATNTLTADVHDLQIIHNGNALMTIYNYQTIDLSSIGGFTNTQYIDCVIQELNGDGQLEWEWRQSDHIPITDTYEIITGTTTDPYHMNAVELDQDGNVLISSRHLSEITKINRATGEIMWRLGGKANQFTFVNDGGFSYQHDIRRLPNGNITLWDNGVQKSPPYSRAVEYEINETNKIITRVWEYRETPDVYGYFMGNIQRLPNGNSFLGWGGPNNRITEVEPDGSKRFEMTVDSTSGFIYRAFRFPWSATPATTPTLILTDVVASEPALHFSWNGATDVSSYRLEGWNLSKTLTHTAVIPKTGFENSVHVSALPEFACYLRVMPLDKTGKDTRNSDVVYRGGARCDAQVSIAVHIPLLAGATQ